MKSVLSFLAIWGALFCVGACASKGTLNNSTVETVRVDERLYEVRIAPTDIENEYRMLIVRATLVIYPDPEREYTRDWNVARRYMARTCRGQAYKVLEDRLEDKVNLYTRFHCGA
ncbi:hypothetical protein SAMN02745126_01431 [Enhydrobacter aerosaccus]|uniref:Lipoprotein n=1 Tax=Enhydrobacter aerosaccus TaxID=225324 RepID=A0A1T4L9A9_9HYPH|nr:hypothetical protein [Enhydrobacter aerosaccus]SJZ51345.1 hypothetical protein SAMN02745126_01431 [Enhydrobacter aerosaccus]